MSLPVRSQTKNKVVNIKERSQFEAEDEKLLANVRTYLLTYNARTLLHSRFLNIIFPRFNNF